MSATSDGFDHLDPGGRAVAGVARRPRGLVWAAVAAAVVLSWAMLGVMASGGIAARGPGGWLLDALPSLPVPVVLERFLDLCLGTAVGGPADVARFAALAAMWMLMSVAMMLPSAAPLIRTYCEIADTAGAKGEPVVHPLVLVAGYLTVWLAASLAFAGLSLGVSALAGPAAALSPVTGVAGAVALALAGLYQFSGLKEACLKKCRRPFTILFSRWSTRTPAVYRLGVEQGVWCIGCCWALMLVMFAVGLMNLFWMALIAVFALVEKQGRGHAASRIAGVILLVWSLALLVLSAGVA